MRLKDKRGLGTAAIVIIAVCVIVAIGGIIFFYSGLSETGIGGGKPSPVSEQCAFACDSGQKASFCEVERKADDSVTATCNELATNSQYSKYNVQTCPTVSCVLTAQELDKTCVTGLSSVWATPNSEGMCPSQDDKFSRTRSPSDSPPVAGQICCYYYE